MTKFFSPSKQGFYDHDVHGKDGTPIDAVEITDEEWQELLTQQSNGKEIATGVHGRPMARDRDPSADLLPMRDRALADSDWLVARHRDEVETGVATTLTDKQYKALQRWRHELRHLSAHPEFPRVALPPKPV